MDRKEYVKTGLFIMACILINIVGCEIANLIKLPIVVNSMGTALTACACGPICGAVVGAATYIIMAIFKGELLYAAYAFTGIAVGLITGYCAKKNYLESLYGILTTGFLVTIISVILSTPINCLLSNGYTGNIWGDGVIDLLLMLGCNSIISYIVGEFYVDFLDRVLLLIFVYVIIKLHKKYKSRGSVKSSKVKNRFLALTLILIILASQGILSANICMADEAVKFNTYVQTLYNDENGLTGGTANDIAQTKDGILWVGTYGGLYRYNGSKFEWMKDFESVKTVNCFYTDEEGRLWIGTNDNGLSICINNNIFNVINKENGLPANSVRCIAEGANGNYYVGTTDSMAIVTLSSGLSVTSSIDEIQYAKSISVNEEGVAAVVDDKGNLFILKDDKILSEKSCDIDNMIFTCCSFDSNGNLYVGTSENRVDVYSLKNGLLEDKGSIQVPELEYFKAIDFYDNQVGILCANNGAAYLDKYGNCYKINANDFNNSLEHSLFDYQGNLWFTSSRLGMLKLCPSAFTEVFEMVGLGETVVNTVTKWQNNMYFGTDNGLCITNGEMTEVLDKPLVQSLKNVRIRCLMVDTMDRLWISTSGNGVLCVNANGEISSFDSSNGALGDKFRMSLELSDNSFALAGDYGITFVRNGKVENTVDSEKGLKNPKVLCLSELKDGKILAGTDGNGIAVIEKGKIIKTLHKANGLTSDIILKIINDENGVFVVTGNGLCYMDKEYNIRSFDNFPYYNNYDIVMGQDNIMFVLGSAGIYAVNKEELLSGKDLNYLLLNSKRGLRNSLTPNSWNYIDENNNLYLSSNKGVTKFNINDYNSEFKSYRMQLKSVIVDGIDLPIEEGETINLQSGADNVVLSPEIINYSTNDPYVSLFLEGYDTEPTVVRLSELSDVSYSNLPAGNYNFKIGVLNYDDEVMIENFYPIVKVSEIYDYWWFRVYIAFVFCLAIVYLTWMIFRTQIQRTLNIQKKELELAKQQVEMGNETILTIARAVDAKDPNTSQHSIRVSEYSSLIAKRLGYDDAACEELKKTALLHDIGKIGVPDSVLKKPSRLTDEEFAIIKSHVVKGAEILKNFTYVKNIVDGAQYHHERYDGKGYMQGLKGEEIPLNARIICVADSFDAMTANRVYRKKLDIDYVINELKNGRGTQFDPKIVDVMLGLIEDGSIQIDKLYSE